MRSASSTAFFLCTAVVGLVIGTGCAKLTEPSKDDPIQADPGAVEPKAAPPPSARPAPSAAAPRPVPTEPAADPGPPGELKITDSVVGKGPEAKTGDIVKVNYTGMLADGSVFDTSKKPGGQPFDLKLGTGQVIQGWEKGLLSMKAGGKRKLVIPPQMAYGPRGRPPVIPPNSTLTFDVEMMEIKK